MAEAFRGGVGWVFGRWDEARLFEDCSSWAGVGESQEFRSWNFLQELLYTKQLFESTWHALATLTGRRADSNWAY